MTAEDNIGLDSTSKSLRGYTTYPHPMFMERLRQHYPDLGPSRTRKGRSFSYEVDTDGFSGSQFVNTALQSFYKQEVDPDTESSIMYPRLSMKTLIRGSGFQETMRLQVETWVSEHASLERNMTRLRDLAVEELGEHTITDLLDDYTNSKFSNSVLSFLFSHGWTFPAHRPVSVEGRVEPIGGLTMKTKYYVSRDDNRAYCQDKHRLRHLVGCCLQRLILPKSMSIRSSLDISKVIRSKGKDELKLIIPRAREGCSTILILGDISNFTGSLANSWLMLHALALDIAKSLSNKCSYFSIGGTLLYATWHELIALYLYLTVGAECYVEQTECFDFLPGGYLGVASNIQTGLLCLALVMMDLTRRILKAVIHTQCQAGGDDFAFLLVVDDRTKDEVVNLIERDMRTYVGELKEFSVIELDDCDDGVLEGYRFCKKRITLRRSSTHTVLGYEPSCPINACLLPADYIKRQDLQCRAWTELDNGLLKYEKEVPGMARFCDSLREAFLIKYPSVHPVRSLVTRFWPPYGLSGECKDGTLISDKAKEAVDQLPRVDIGSHTLLATRHSKIRHLQVQEVIVGIDVVYQGKVVTAYILQEEQGCLVTERTVGAAGVHPDEVSLRRILTILAR